MSRFNEWLRGRTAEKPQPPKTFEEFLEMVRASGATSIEAHMLIKTWRRTRSATVGVIADLEFYTQFKANKGRAVFEETYEGARDVISERGILDERRQDDMTTRLAITALNRLNGAKASLPEVSTVLYMWDKPAPQSFLGYIETYRRAHSLIPFPVKRT